MGLIRILVLALGALLAYTLFRKIMGSIGGRQNPLKDDERLGRLVQDPQCHIYVDPQEAIRRKVPDGELFFCSDDCADKFMEGQDAESGGA